MAALQGCVIALSGTFPGRTHSELGKAIKEMGGGHAGRVGSGVTHLVVLEKEGWGEGAKVKQAAEYPDIKLVNLDWLLESIETQSKVDEHSYLMTKSDFTGTKSHSPMTKSDSTVTKSGSTVQKSNSTVTKSDSAAAKSDITTTTKNKDNGKKRTRDERIKEEHADEAETAALPAAKKQKDSQKAKSKSLNIPVDEGCSLAGTHRVYVDKSGTIFDASLNQTNAGNNANKFYRVQLLTSGNGSYSTWTRWGRVGERGQSALLGDGSHHDAFAQFEKKFKDKSGHKWSDRLNPPKKGKYTFVERNYESDSEDDDELPGAGSRRQSKTSVSSGGSIRKTPESTLAPQVQSLMRFIFNQDFFVNTMAAMSYDANKLPLGKLSKRTLKSGFEALKELAELLSNPSLADEVHNMSYTDAILEISNSYYSTIPHSFGRNRPPVISNNDLLKREVELLESLSDMSIAEEIMKGAKDDSGSSVHPLDNQYAALGLNEMTPLQNKSTEYKELENYLLKTHGSTHGMTFKVEDIFRIERNGENDRFAQSPFAKLQADRRLLWHGSRATNFGGILSQGLRIAPPEAPVNGYMFGKGVYLADISSKSAGYCAYYDSGMTGLLLLCEAELGNPMLELVDADPLAPVAAKEKGCYATWGKGLTGPAGWKSAECVHKELKGVTMPDTTRPPGPTGVDGAGLYYNEYIAYDVAQIRLRYLLRVKMS
ncbi:hypothetical protein MMC27_002898 [Xylographa pallens]|nr:hypothetical protein [Xylographa pallens]